MKKKKCDELRLCVKMSSSSEMVALPLLKHSDYAACSIPYRLPSDDPHNLTPTELAWVNVLLNTIPSFKYLSSSLPFF